MFLISKEAQPRELREADLALPDRRQYSRAFMVGPRSRCQTAGP